MNRYVAFLRGMNLGNRRLKNEELRAHFETLGCAEVATFRASGNVIFSAAGKLGELTEKLESGLAEALDYEVPVFLRTAEELTVERRELPWLPDGGISESELDWKAVEAALGPTTVRTKGTIDRIAAKHLD